MTPLSILLSLLLSFVQNTTFIDCSNDSSFLVRRLLSADSGSLPFGRLQDDVCAICMDRARSSCHNSSECTVPLFFPQCHGYQFCELCITTICENPSKLQRRCPSCRRSVHPLIEEHHYESSDQRLEANHIFDNDQMMEPPIDMDMERRAEVEEVHLIDHEHRYHRYIERLQREDNSTLQCIKIWNTHNPLRHRLRNRYYQSLREQWNRPIFTEHGLRQQTRGCCYESAALVCRQRSDCCCGDIVCLFGFAVAHSFSICCCFVDCCCGEFCRDFCLCEPPMDLESIHFA